MALATASKGTSSISEYIAKMKGLADEMAALGRRLEDEELVSYVLKGLDLHHITGELEKLTTRVSYGHP
jgi:hypothetical protein